MMKIRLVTEKDAKDILHIYSPYIENTSITFETAVPSIEEMEQRITKVMKEHAWIVAEIEEKIVAYAYASQHRERLAYKWSTEVSVYIDENYHGKGIGKALYKTLFALLKVQGYYNAYAGITLPNEASVGIHEYFGFKRMAHFHNVGYKSGKWHDVGWWELFLQEHVGDPSYPLALKEIPVAKLDEILRSCNGI